MITDHSFIKLLTISIAVPRIWLLALIKKNRNARSGVTTIEVLPPDGPSSIGVKIMMVVRYIKYQA